MQKAPYDITIFLIVVTGLILFMVAFIISIVFLYRKRQQAFEENLEEIKLGHEKNLLAARLEMQEQTFQHISREIHDNISLSLTLAKLQLNTFDWNNRALSTEKLNQSVELLSRSIGDLNHLSRGLNAEIIIQQGLLRAVEDEVYRIRKAGLFTLEYSLTGEPVFLPEQSELIIFRIIQEAFNNIIKHAQARHTLLALHYNSVKLTITITDDGHGFDSELLSQSKQAGLKNMQTRSQLLGGQMNINTQPGQGCTLTFTIPFKNHEQ